LSARSARMRMTLVVALVALVGFAVAQPHPIRPHISETFEGEGYTHVVTGHEVLWGLGRWAIDEPAGHGVEFWEFPHEHRHHSVHLLQRYDLKSVYAITFHHLPHPHHECRKHTVQPPMPPMWHWIRDAHYHGKHLVDGTTYDVWGHIHAAHDSEVAVSELHSSRPHYYTRRSLTEHRTTHLIGWATYKPNATWFHVPEVCKNATDDVVGWMDVTEDIKLGGGCAVASESKMELAANADATSLLIAAAFDKAGLTADITKEASACTGGARAGDVFVDGTPVKSAAVFMGGDEFAECKSGGCEITGWRAFSGLCRRFC